MIIKNKKSTTALILISTVLLVLFIKSGSQFKSIASKHAQKLYLKYSYSSVDDYRIASYSNDEMDQLRRNLSIHFPYKKNTDEIPRNIWQIWKSDDVTTLDQGLQNLIHTWKDQENFTYTLVQDTKLGEFLHDTFIDTAPAVLEALDKLPEIILKTDFARYLLMFVYGGVYSDIDTRANQNITSWLSYNNTITPDLPNQIGLVMGIESDRDEKNWYRDSMARRLQYCQWTLQSKPGHPMYRELIARIVDITLNGYDTTNQILHTKDGSKFDLKKSSSTRLSGILQWTGPGVITDAVFDYLNDVYKTSEFLDPELDFKNDKMIDPNRKLNLFSKVKYEKLRGYIHNGYDPIERPWGWQNLTKQEKPILFDDDVLLLPRKSFGNIDGGQLDYVKHFFKGTWKNN
ncbi:Initiation-specific alpha-1,6-mannosyltransferase [Wickerhamomyces ciferrii]|uniref:Initiation-specific alpha-1,6-mannosyltransferase n=1 Tax=Wickerhamomyces ciferrii (strain ATCC 14091 / BCRC 22168 / CBS 111 / JCM 3599 / NBRC 0793 / NRRL Y-1031 F-60-10) TaxID=1206466 RepID=K0KBI6_WICCF|nr:Initiation-specific alpha-1,6-mannosyltransferase [Wickerhamomyces ciferrii]CCH42390.1 Initiation-specific alpha-1,6-mannosyltransferase [Wickerhamomyces ciferrii]